jgi:YhcH/YjgK/YiaL family protein
MAILGDVTSALAQAKGSPRLQHALHFAAELILNHSSKHRISAAQLKDGDKFEVPIEGTDLFAIFQAYSPRERKEGCFEAHKEFTDIQFLLEGEEHIEVCPLGDLSRNPEFDANKNVFFPLGTEPTTRLLLKPGLVAILFPSDAHAPTLATGKHAGRNLKVVIKARNALD